MRKLILAAIFLSGSFALAQAPSGDELLSRIDRNYEAGSKVSVSSMKISGRRGARTMKTKSWTRGTDKAFTEYLEPAREKGTKMLKLADELWIWSPGADRVIKIAGHMLRQSMNGSDISYEDFMQDPVLSNSYAASVSGEETIGDRPCYVLNLSAKREDVSYFFRKIWVDTERYLPLKEELYAKSMKLLKVIKILDVFQLSGRWYPRKLLFKDVLMEGAGTEIDIDSIDFDAEIPDYMFSKASLKK